MQKNPEDSSFNYPEVPLNPTPQVYEGPDGLETYTDNYAWLKEHRTDPGALRYVEQQRNYTDSYFARSGIESELQQAFASLTYGGTERTIGVKRGDETYYRRADPHDEHGKVVASKNGVERVIVDPNTMEGNTSLTWFTVSPEGTHMAYSVMRDDREEPTVYIRSLEDDTESQFYSGDYFTMNWDANNKGFTYITSHGREHGAAKYNYQMLRHHTIGTDRSEDVLLIDAARTCLGSEVFLGFDQSDDGKHMLIEARKSDKTVDLYLFDVEGRTLSRLFPEVAGRCQGSLLDGHILVRPDTGDDNQYIARTPIDEAVGRPLAQWQTFIPPRKGHYIKSHHVTRSSIVVEYAHDVDSKIVLFDRQTGAASSQLKIPSHSGLLALSGQQNSDTFDYTISNAITRQDIYRYNGGSSSLFYGSHHNLDPNEYEIVKKTYESDDGTRVPLYLAAKKGIIGEEDAGVIVDCYGGFMNGAFPEKQYTNLYRAWMKLGQIVARPCIRGGNEFGKAWHSQAVGNHKYKTIEDINAAARYLHDETIAERIGLSGGSSGGAMVLAAMIQQPESYGSVEARVPLADMLEYMNLPGTGNYWTKEYGDPRVPHEYAALRKWSPYHNIREGVQYPPLLLTAGLNDTRVDATHAIKMAAKMQHLSPDSLTLLHINPDTGHGHGMSASQWHAYYARRIAFHMLQLGVTLKG